MRILLTGARGQLGHALSDEFKDEQLSGLSHSELDITDRDAVAAALSRHEPELLINAAAYTDVDGAESDSGLAFRMNADGPKNLATLAASAGIPLLHLSTDYVFDGNTDKPYTEDDTPCPASEYGRSKFAGEQAIREVSDSHFIVRTSWLYHTPGHNFLRTMYELAKKGGAIRVVNDQVGSPTFAPHLCRGIRSILSGRDFGIWHIAGTGAASWYELTVRFFHELGVATPVVPVTTDEFPRPAPRPRYSVLETSRDHPIVLPAWENGVVELANVIRANASDR